MERIETHLPILDTQEEVQVFQVDAVDAQRSVSEVKLHEFPRGTTTVNVTTGIGDLPSFVSFAQDLVDQNPG